MARFCESGKWKGESLLSGAPRYRPNYNNNMTSHKIN